MVESQPILILMVEDDPGHARLIEKNLYRAQITNDLMILNDGQSAIDYLFKENGYAGAQHLRPHLVLLDLNLPELDGYQVLERVKTDERTRSIPVIMLTTTDDPDDIKRCYELGCQAYFTKPVDYTQLFKVIRTLRSYR